jgi:hypothetical protein
MIIVSLPVLADASLGELYEPLLSSFLIVAAVMVGTCWVQGRFFGRWHLQSLVTERFSISMLREKMRLSIWDFLALLLLAGMVFVGLWIAAVRHTAVWTQEEGWLGDYTNQLIHTFWADPTYPDGSFIPRGWIASVAAGLVAGGLTGLYFGRKGACRSFDLTTKL